MPNKSEPKLLFVTNLPAPYRFPIWDALSKEFSLNVAFTLGEKNWRNWNPPHKTSWTFEFLSLPFIRVREYELILSSPRVKNILKGVDAIIVGSWETPVYIHLILLSRKLKIPLIMIYESHADSQLFKKGLVDILRSWLFRKADLIVTFGSASTRAVKEMDVEQAKIFELFNACDTEFFHVFANANRKVPSKGHKFLYVGQIIERKNIVSLIKAFSYVHDESDSLLIVGNGVELKNLKNLTREVGCSEKISFLDHKKPHELREIYSSCHTLILPSTNEVWGLVVNEALTCGMHVVVSRACGVSELISNMRGSYLCSPDEVSIGEAMKMSKSDWRGHIPEPEILKYSPTAFAERITVKLKSLLPQKII